MRLSIFLSKIIKVVLLFLLLIDNLIRYLEKNGFSEYNGRKWFLRNNDFNIKLLKMFIL